MGNVKKVLLINIGILVSYTAFFGLTSHGQSLEFTLSMMIAIGLQVLINLLISIACFVQKENEYGKAFLASAGLVLLIGFSACSVGHSFYK